MAALQSQILLTQMTLLLVLNLLVFLMGLLFFFNLALGIIMFVGNTLSYFIALLVVYSNGY